MSQHRYIDLPSSSTYKYGTPVIRTYSMDEGNYTYKGKTRKYELK